MGTAISKGIVAFARDVGAVCGDAPDLLFGRDLVEQFGQDGCIHCAAVACLQALRGADVAAADLDFSDFQCFLVDPNFNQSCDPRRRLSEQRGLGAQIAKWRD